MDPTLVTTIWSRLLTGKPLEDLHLPVVDGRIDLRGLVAPEPAVLREYATLRANVKELQNLVVIRRGRWKNLDLSRSKLAHLRFHDSTIENCLFDEAKCADWRIWGTSVSNSSFRGADLREAALGGIENEKRNSFYNVDFTKADLRKTSYFSSDMTRCKFSNTRLSNVDFEGTVFVDCSFEGILDEVLFNRFGFQGETFPPNEMRGVDFRGAKLRWVEFRELDMDRVHWPEDDEHIILENYPETLDRLLTIWGSRSDTSARQLAAAFEVRRKWIGPKQKVDIVSKVDLIEIGGEEAVLDVLRVIGR